MANNQEPVAEQMLSTDDATVTPWADVRESLKGGGTYWLATVRPNGRPHVTPLFAVWLEDALYFCTGPSERKAKNLVVNSQCVVTTGCNVNEGLDVVVEGEAVQVNDEARLQRVADRFASK